MKTRNFYLLALLSVSLFASCEAGDINKSTAPLSIDANVDQMTRASKSEFQSGDEIGLFVLNTEGNNYNDCDCSFNNQSVFSTVWTLKENIQLTDHVGTVYAYYPYSKEVNDFKQIPIQSTSQTDYLIANPTTVDATNSVATLRMRHAMSLVKFTIKKDGYTGSGQITNIMLQGIGLSGTLNVSNGAITTSRIGNESYKSDVELVEPSITIGLIAFPQVVTSTILLITIDGEKYSYNLAPSKWEPGKETNYTLKINQDEKTFISIGNATIDGWGSGGSYEGVLSGGGIDIGTEI